VSNDELVIEQAYTYPLSRMALYTGVRDDTKHNGTTAGGSYKTIISHTYTLYHYT
jgi:hypothetical protein